MTLQHIMPCNSSLVQRWLIGCCKLKIKIKGIKCCPTRVSWKLSTCRAQLPGFVSNRSRCLFLYFCMIIKVVFINICICYYQDYLYPILIQQSNTSISPNLSKIWEFLIGTFFMRHNHQCSSSMAIQNQIVFHIFLFSQLMFHICLAMPPTAI